ncbi:hypothetical protein So717_42670 [Roseobacter cerasinus]|uniref:Uncharacterized protein n=1 Tax=Roseobacter cerasinus TaxID=2602289 RepID=A0A640VY45_9RHOB|nr:hypothetical protein So717_42670 [Roseobacter cerasinus]
MRGAKQLVDVWQAEKQCPYADVVADLSGGHEQGPSTRGLPWSFGKKGFKPVICASVSQKRSNMLTARF